jgi:hypothetical protein
MSAFVRLNGGPASLRAVNVVCVAQNGPQRRGPSPEISP